MLLCLVTVLTLFSCNGEEPAESTSETDIKNVETVTDAATKSKNEATTDDEAVESNVENPESNTQEADSETEKASATEKAENTTEKAESVTEKDEITTEKTEIETERPNVTVTVNGKSATVTSGAGLTYTATGFESVSGEHFIFTNGLTLNLDDKRLEKAFNRLSLTYSATEPLHIFVTYKTGSGAEKTDDFYLEAGEGIFSGLVTDYINQGQGNTVSKIVVDTCKGEKASFALYHVNTEVIKVYVGSDGSKTYYISNGRFKLGVDMGWGGTINYLEDLSKKVSGLTNLVNKHDTGRLIQQSYYGTGAIEGVFPWGSFNNNDKWPYNPVQGGDRGRIASRLVDVQVKGNYVYIKAQPMDWGKVGYMTPSYMENWYTLEEDFVRVDNRFVDFSGWTHPVKNQELPAFYTVSYLDSFVWYDGTAPWTGGWLSSRDNLPFWGNATTGAECRFPVRYSNTETWCAWVNNEIDFGIGLYVPNVDRLLAGRNAYNGSKDANASATNYVAMINAIKLVAFEALEYSYLITTGSVEEIRETFTENKNFADNESLRNNYVSLRVPDEAYNMTDLEFTDESSIAALTNPHNASIEFDAQEGAVKLIVLGNDPYVHLKFEFADKTYYADDFVAIEVEYMIPASNASSSYKSQLFTCTGTVVNPVAAASVTSGEMTVDSQYHNTTFDLSAKDFWTGKINQLRFDFFNNCSVGDVIYVRSIKFVTE